MKTIDENYTKLRNTVKDMAETKKEVIELVEDEDFRFIRQGKR